MLKIYTASETFNFIGKDEKEVYRLINDAGARGAEWTVPITLKSKKRMVFILKNIIAMELD